MIINNDNETKYSEVRDIILELNSKETRNEDIILYFLFIYRWYSIFNNTCVSGYGRTGNRVALVQNVTKDFTHQQYKLFLLEIYKTIKPVVMLSFFGNFYSIFWG